MNTTTSDSGTTQYLSFRLGESVFALEIFDVGDRGVPVIDLHRKFATGTTALSKDTCIVIAEVEDVGEALLAGAPTAAVASGEGVRE